MDDLTGLLSRKEFVSQIRSRSIVAGWLIYIDVDSLRFANAVFHYEMADEFLRRLAALIRSTCADDEILARYGGDEFLIYAPPARDPAILAEHIRKCVADNFDVERASIRSGTSGAGVIDAPAALLTVSIGVSALRHGELDQALSAVDFANQQAKVAGRNCVVHAESAEH